MSTAESSGDVRLRFYEELNDFIAPRWHKRDIRYRLNRRTSVKDLIEAHGVPHTEVDLVLVDGESVGFDHIVAAGERIAVYPKFESLDISGLTHVRPTPLRDVPRFLCDVHLGTLARYLRLAGFDTLWRNDLDDAELAEISAREHRVLLTRDRRLLQRRILTHAIFVRDDRPRQQFRQVCSQLDLSALVRPLGRCSRCNGRLVTGAKARIARELEPGTRRRYDRFWRCESCAQVYWRGSHYDPIRRLLEALTGEPAAGR